MRDHMNRRSFFNTILKAGAGCMILPAATTYTRHWSGLLVPQDQSLDDGLWEVFVWANGEVSKPIRLCYAKNQETVDQIVACYHDLGFPAAHQLARRLVERSPFLRL